MTTYTAEQLQEILKKHAAWRRDEEGGKRADFYGADLSDADLTAANLTAANLSYANLTTANLRFANLTAANLRFADLNAANLNAANLRYANLTAANLSAADLYGADLRAANLYGADLRGADLYGANLNWDSHALLSEILYRASGSDLGRQALAALIGCNTGWCWAVWLSDDAPEGVDQDDWLSIVVDHRAWALTELAKWVKDGDGAPDAVHQYVQKAVQA